MGLGPRDGWGYVSAPRPWCDGVGPLPEAPNFSNRLSSGWKLPSATLSPGYELMPGSARSSSPAYPSLSSGAQAQAQASSCSRPSVWSVPRRSPRRPCGCDSSPGGGLGGLGSKVGRTPCLRTECGRRAPCQVQWFCS